jgi:hypothetical protein
MWAVNVYHISTSSELCSKVATSRVFSDFHVCASQNLLQTNVLLVESMIQAFVAVGRIIKVELFALNAAPPLPY